MLCRRLLQSGELYALMPLGAHCRLPHMTKQGRSKAGHLRLPVADFQAPALKAHYADKLALIICSVCCSEDILCFGFRLFLYLLHVQVRWHLAVPVPPKGKVG